MDMWGSYVQNFMETRGQVRSERNTADTRENKMKCVCMYEMYGINVCCVMYGINLVIELCDVT